MGLRQLLVGDESRILDHSDFQVLLFANVVGALGIVIVSPILDTLTGPFGVSEGSIGLVVSAYTAPPIVAIPLLGIVSDRIGRKPVLITGLLVFGLSGAAIPLAPDFRTVLGLRFIQGLGFSAIIPVVIVSIGDLYRDIQEATAQGFRVTVSGLANVVFPLLTGALVTLSWTYPFYLYLVALPIAVLVVLWFEEPTAQTDGGETTSELATDTADIALPTLLRRPRVSAILIARALPSGVWIGFMTYNSFIVIRLLNGTPQQAALLVATGSLALAFSATQVGRLTTIFDSQLQVILAGHLGLLGGFLLVAFAPSLPVVFVGAFVTGLAFGVIQSLYRSVLTGLAPPSLRGGLVSLGESLERTTLTAVPAIMGVCIAAATPEFGFGPALRWTCVGVALLVGVAAFLLIGVVAKADGNPAAD